MQVIFSFNFISVIFSPVSTLLVGCRVVHGVHRRICPRAGKLLPPSSLSSLFLPLHPDINSWSDTGERANEGEARHFIISPPPRVLHHLRSAFRRCHCRNAGDMRVGYKLWPRPYNLGSKFALTRNNDDVYEHEINTNYTGLRHLEQPTYLTSQRQILHPH